MRFFGYPTSGFRLTGAPLLDAEARLVGAAVGQTQVKPDAASSQVRHLPVEHALPGSLAPLNLRTQAVRGISAGAASPLRQSTGT